MLQKKMCEQTNTPKLNPGTVWDRYNVLMPIFLPDLRQKKQTLLLVENPTYVITSISTNPNFFLLPNNAICWTEYYEAIFRFFYQ